MRSVGQGNFYSKLSHKITSDRTSVIKRLASRSLTGQGLQMRIHQHIWFKLHVVWHASSKGKESLRCIERVFSMYSDVKDFCDELMGRAFEGLCDCVCVHVLE